MIQCITYHLPYKTALKIEPLKANVISQFLLNKSPGMTQLSLLQRVGDQDCILIYAGYRKYYSRLTGLPAAKLYFSVSLISLPLGSFRGQISEKLAALNSTKRNGFPDKVMIVLNVSLFTYYSSEARYKLLPHVAG